MCAEDGWDGGALYISTNGGAWNQAFVNYSNNTNWYDGTITVHPDLLEQMCGMVGNMLQHLEVGHVQVQ